MKTILEPLNLIYYEYDEKMNLLILDKNGAKNHTFNELMKITYALSSHNLHS